MKTVLKNAKIEGKICDLILQDGWIKQIGHTAEDGEDLKGATVVAGLIDIHTHGCGGYDTMEGSVSEMARLQWQAGVMAYCPTTTTMPMDQIAKATEKMPQTDGAENLGFHMEGPYLSQKYRGAQNEQYLLSPSMESFSKVRNIRLLTLAPELDGAMDFIKQSGVPVFLGHTTCDYELACAAFHAGAVGLTHTFNAMSPIHHRMPGPILAALDCNAYVQVICDGIHIHPAVIRMLYRLFGRERMLLISDSMRATGLGDGLYDFGGQKIQVLDGIARTPEGVLAGSTATLYDCVQKAISFGIPWEDAYFMASATPAAALNLKRGQVKEGFRADLLVLNETHQLTRIIRG